LTRYTPFYVQNYADTAQIDRMAYGDIFGANLAVLTANAFQVIPSAFFPGSMSVDVQPGRVAFPGNLVMGEGTYYLYSDSPENMPLAPADATNPRIDVIVAQVENDHLDSSGHNDFVFVVLTGTPAVGPVAPVVGPNQLAIATVAVAANASTIVAGNITYLLPPQYTPGGGAPSGTAGGDLSGTYPNPTVDGLQGTPVGTLASATSGQMLAWNGSAWIPMTPPSGGGGPPSGAAGGDLSGSYPNPGVAKINGSQVNIASPAVNQVLTYSGSFWANTVCPPSPPNGSAGGDLSSTYPNPTVARINGTALGTLSGAASGNLLSWNGSAWVPVAPPAASGTAGGDLSGSYPNPTVARINGSPLGTVTGAATNSKLGWNGSAWVPQALPASLPPSGAAGGDLSGTYPNPTVSMGVPAAVGSGSGLVSFTDDLGDVWVAKGGVNGGVYKRARDVLHAAYVRNAALSTVATAGGSGVMTTFDGMQYDDYGMWQTGVGNQSAGGFVTLVPGMYRLTAQMVCVPTAGGQWLDVGIYQTNFRKVNNVVMTPGVVNVNSTFNLYYLTVNAQITMRCVANDIMQVGAWSNAAGLTYYVNNAYSCLFQINYLGTG
jgi:hypothetical protein